MDAGRIRSKAEGVQPPRMPLGSGGAAGGRSHAAAHWRADAHMLLPAYLHTKPNKLPAHTHSNTTAAVSCASPLKTPPLLMLAGSLGVVHGHWNAPLPPRRRGGGGGGGVSPASCGAPFSNGESFPVLLFSHGVAGQRNLYSALCAELASRGFVVAALEHADGSASIARLP
eukprot:363264-Chlamydomonas_euryale.AAC.1